MIFFDFRVFNRGITKHNVLIIHQKISYFYLLSFLNYPHLSYFRLLVLICTMGKVIGRSYKYNWSKISTLTLKKPVLSSSAAHTSSAWNLTQTSISSQLDNEDSTTNKNKNNTSNTDDMHSCVTPRKKLQCSGHIYNHSFNTIKHYTAYCTCWVTQNKTINPDW